MYMYMSLYMSSYAINHTSLVGLCLSSIVASYHLISLINLPVHYICKEIEVS